jgi:hypothetical protein
MRARWQSLPRWLRVGGAASLAVGLWLLGAAASPSWVAVPVAFVFFAVLTGAIESSSPTLVERAVGDAPLVAAIGADSSVNSDGWALALPGDLIGSDYPPQGLIEQSTSASIRLAAAAA